jgi:hypothetical protein
MTMAPWRHLQEAPPISARERAIPFGPRTAIANASLSDPSHAQPSVGSRASRSQHRAAVPRLARSRRPRRAAKSP